MSRKLLIVAALLAAACSDQTDITEPAAPREATSAPEPSDLELDFNSRHMESAHTALSGGATTVFDATLTAFSLPAPNLSGRSLGLHDVGDVNFEVEFSSTPGAPNAGLGPVFDNVSCEACHEGDGRGRALPLAASRSPPCCSAEAYGATRRTALRIPSLDSVARFN